MQIAKHNKLITDIEYAFKLVLENNEITPIDYYNYACAQIKRDLMNLKKDESEEY
jgi:hypothetical protein